MRYCLLHKKQIWYESDGKCIKKCKDNINKFKEIISGKYQDYLSENAYYIYKIGINRIFNGTIFILKMKQHLPTLVNKFVSQLKTQLLKDLKHYQGSVTNDVLAQRVNEILVDHSSRKFRTALSMIADYQQTIIDQQEEIGRLKKQIQTENELVYNFMRNLRREEDKQNSLSYQNSCKLIRKDSSIFNTSSQNNSEYSIFDQQSHQNSILFNKTDTHEFKTLQKSKHKSKAKPSTSRSKLSGSRYQASEFATQLEQDEKQKSKAFAKLRKLQMYVYGKQNISRKDRNEKIWDCGVSPTKKYYQEQNDSLKAIQNNLLTHLSLMQKFKGVPSLESLIAREEALRRKEKVLLQKSDALEQKEINLNKKHAQILKSQKSYKML